MLKQIVSVFILSLCVYSAAIAEDNIACPSVEQIKQEELIPWLPLYKENEELAFDSDVNTFKEHVTVFDVARWVDSYLENAHCFYKGTDPIVERIVLAQDAWQPTDNAPWIWLIPHKFAECRSLSVNDCMFIK